MKPALCFLKVQTVQEKLAVICSTLAQQFHRGERWIVLADTARAVDYLDELLWRFPPDSFLPHAISDGPSDERIVLTSQRRNLNQATLAFSFLERPLLEPLGVRVIYELDDRTTPEKERASSQRRDLYLAEGFRLAESSS